MGFYSCLKVHCVLKDEYVKVIEELYQIWHEIIDGKRRKSDSLIIWEIIIDKFELLFIKKWIKNREGTSMIPFGWNGGYTLDEWEDKNLNGNNWKFICEFKNYGNEIDSFINQVLPKICTKIVHCEYIDDNEENSIMLYENYEVE